MIFDDLNAPRWTGRRHRGHFEAWYLTIALPDQGESFWLRYTLEVPGPKDQAGHAGLWAFGFDKKAPAAGLALHDRYPLERFANKTTEDKGFKIEIGKAILDRGKAKGKVGAGDRAIEWDVTFEPRGPSLAHVSPALYLLGLAKTSSSAPQLALEVNGTIKAGDRTAKLAKAPGEQGHVFGTKHVADYTWAHCNAFAEDPEAVFEGVSARVRKLGILFPPGTPIYLRAFGKEHRLNGITTLWSADSEFELGRWAFEAEGSDSIVRGVVKAPPERFVSVEYRDPDGDGLFCNNSCLADMTLEVYEKRGARWEKTGKLTSDGTTAFEVAGRERDPRVARRLDLAEARAAE